MVNIKQSHNPYFSRWFSAIFSIEFLHFYNICHNPYFSRWFSAIAEDLICEYESELSQSLF